MFVVIAVVLMSAFTCEKIAAIASFENYQYDVIPQTVRCDVRPPIRNCRDVQRRGNTTNGIYTIFPYKCCLDIPLQVYCDMKTDGGGWTVIQRRADIEPREDFYRTWMEYALGFGDLIGEFWLGNDNIHALTDQTLNEIRIDLKDFEQNRRYAKYSFFYVHDRSSSYRLEVLGYKGTAGDSLAVHNGMKFTAKDVNNDKSLMMGSCAETYKGGWWYEKCLSSNLNGLYHYGNLSSEGQGIIWHLWGESHSLSDAEMKIRPAY